VPVAAMRPFGNTILFNFDFVPANGNAVAETASSPLSGQVLCKSSLDLDGLALWTPMPNLELFANAGFPFTQLADMSQTTVVLPTVPSKEEISLYLHLMSHFGEQTGYPALRVTVAGPNSSISNARDYLILGTVTNQPAFASLDPLLPVTLDSTGIHVKQAQTYIPYRSSINSAVARWWSQIVGNPMTESLPSTTGATPDALVEEVESPSSADRSIVLIALRQDSSVNDFASVFLDRSQAGDISGSASLLRDAKFESYRLTGETYHVGNISWYAMMRIWFTQYFLLLLLAVMTLSLLVALWTRDWLSRRARERLKLADTVGAAN
jgi:cellulose synthase (UDP-forming)